jgi:hypothetical protein
MSSVGAAAAGAVGANMVENKFKYVRFAPVNKYQD